MTSLIVYSIPALIYALVVKLREKIPWRDIAKRLGLVAGVRRAYFWAGGLSLVAVAISVVAWSLMPAGLADDPNLATSSFVGRPLALMSFLAALVYGLIETGLGEELLFRGLIGGWLGRQMGLWTATVIQAVIFTLPHLLVLTVEPSLWPLATVMPLAFGLMAGWLRLTSGSIFPGWIVHGMANVATAVVAMVASTM